MPVIKCKQCGCMVSYVDGDRDVRCDACDSPINVGYDNNEKKLRIMERGDQARLACDFARAQREYEAVIRDYPDDAEAHWYWLMSRYGVEFVDDTFNSGRKKPTIHRINEQSILDDPEYKKALELADPIMRTSWENTAKELDRINQRYFELSKDRENEFDIFISFKQHEDISGRETDDCQLARKMYNKLEKSGYRVFFSPETLAKRAGEEYEPVIYAALHSAKVMLLIMSCRKYAEAVWVKNEWSRYLLISGSNDNKHLIPILMNGMPKTELPKELSRIQFVETVNFDWQDDVVSQIERFVPIRGNERFAPTKKNERSFDYYGSQNTTESGNTFLTRADQCLKIGKWNEAKKVYSDACRLDPQCAKAIIGEMLASARCFSLEDYGNQLISRAKEVRPGQELVGLTTDELDSLAEKLTVGNYFTKDDLDKDLPRPEVVNPTVDGLLEIYSEVKKMLGEGSEFEAALGCADGSYKRELLDFKDWVLNEIKRILDAANVEESRLIDSARQKYEKKMEAAVETMRKRSEDAKAQREHDYDEACKSMRKRDMDRSFTLFDKLGDYKDSIQKSEALKRVKHKLNEIGDGRDYLYDQLSKHFPDDLQAYIDVKNKSLQAGYGNRGKGVAVIYALFVFLGVVTGAGMPLAFCALAAFGILWGLKKPRAAFISYLVLMFFALTPGIYTAAGAVILTIIPIISYVKKNGYVRWMIDKEVAETSAEEMRLKGFAGIESELRGELDQIWQDAFHVNYDGVNLKSISEGLVALNQKQTVDLGKLKEEYTQSANAQYGQQATSRGYPDNLHASDNGIIPGVSKKSKKTAMILCVFLGIFGIHRIYVGKIGTGFIYLCTLGLFGIGWVVDMFSISNGTFKDEFDLPLKR